MPACEEHERRSVGGSGPCAASLSHAPPSAVCDRTVIAYGACKSTKDAINGLEVEDACRSRTEPIDKLLVAQPTRHSNPPASCDRQVRCDRRLSACGLAAAA